MSYCEITKERPEFLCLTHQTSVNNLSIILKEGYLLPPRYFYSEDDLRDKRKSSSFFRTGMEGVYMTLVRDNERQKDISWFKPDNIILVFSIALLDRNDYYLSLRDQFGEMTSHTYTKKTIGKVPKINFNPELDTYVVHPNEDMHTTGLNEIMFFEKVPLAFLQEVWIPHTDLIKGNYLASDDKIKWNWTKERTLDIVRPILDYHNYTVPIKVLKKFPNYPSPLIKGCNDKTLMNNQKVYETPLCRSNRYFIREKSTLFGDEIQNVDIPMNRDISLANKKKIASNCGIPKKVIQETNSKDLLNYYIIQKEKEYINFIINHPVRNPENEKKFREFYMRGPKRYHPPFSRPYTNKLDAEINAYDPFRDMTQDFLAYAEKELQNSIRNKVPKVDWDKITKDKEGLAQRVLQRDHEKLSQSKLVFEEIHEQLRTQDAMESVIRKITSNMDRLYNEKNRVLLDSVSERYNKHLTRIIEVKDKLDALLVEYDAILLKIHNQITPGPKKDQITLDEEANVIDMIDQKYFKIDKETLRKAKEMMGTLEVYVSRLNEERKTFFAFVKDLYTR